MKNVSKILLTVMLVMLVAALGCKPDDPGGTEVVDVIKVSGILQAGAATATSRSGKVAPLENAEDIVITAYELKSDGSRELIADGDAAVVNADGTFTLTLPAGSKNVLIFVIYADGTERKYFITEPGVSVNARTIPGRSLQTDNATDNGTDDDTQDNATDDGVDDDSSDNESMDDGENDTDNDTDSYDTDNGSTEENVVGTDYIVVDDESDVEADIVIDEVTEDGTDPGEVDTEDIDEVIDGDIAEAVVDNEELRNCIIRHIQKARRVAHNMLLSVLRDKDLSEDEITDVEQKLKQAFLLIRPLRKELRRTVYDILKANPDDALSQIDDAAREHREKVVAAIEEAGIPLGLYQKARNIATEAFEKALIVTANDCDFPEGLKNRLLSRALVRKILADSIRSGRMLVRTFGYTDYADIEEAFNVFDETVRAMDPEEDNRPEIKDAIRAYYSTLLDIIKTAVPDDLVTDAAIDAVVQGTLQAQRQLIDDLVVAETVDDIKAAYRTFYDTFRTLVAEEFNITEDEDTETLRKKFVLADMLFNIAS